MNLIKNKILFFVIVFQFAFFITAKAQVLNVTNNEQLYNEWCWAGCSKTVLDYYGFSSVQQCDIAEWVRTVATFYNFGTVNCCVDATQGCNYWNYMYSNSGSIHDILVYFGNIQNIGMANSISLGQITNEIQNNRPFVIRWGWSTGGGHFIVGHGINGNNIYFMNPWFGEGLHIGTYNFVLNGVDNTSAATHTWTHTVEMTTNVSGVNEVTNQAGTISISPNPFSGQATTLRSKKQLFNATLTVYNSLGQEMKQLKNISGQTIVLNRDNFVGGLYYVRLTESDQLIASEKFVVSDN